MEVKEILKCTANILNLKKVKSYLDGEIESDSDLLDDLNNLILAVNMTNNLVAANYFELVDSVEIINNKEVIPFEKISNKEIIEIKKVLNSYGDSINFKVKPSGVETLNGNLCIVFSYFPNSVDIDDNINYYTKLNSLVFAMGVASKFIPFLNVAYFCLL